MAYYSNNSGQIPSNAIVRLFLVVVFNIVNKLILVVALFQFLCHLLTGRVPRWAVRCGVAMSMWTYQMSLFMVYETERPPFPFHGISADRD